jgi:hypothetical protein
MPWLSSTKSFLTSGESRSHYDIVGKGGKRSPLAQTVHPPLYPCFFNRPTAFSIVVIKTIIVVLFGAPDVPLPWISDVPLFSPY